MEQQLLPLWTTSKGTTYTEVQTFCSEQYARRGASLIAEVATRLESLAHAKDNSAGLKLLHILNDISIDLSCFNPLWNDFSQAVFESLVFPRSSAWTANYLTSTYTITLRRISHGK